MPRIVCSELYKTYGNMPIFQGLNLEFQKASFSVVVGPSGCGKSSLLRLIAGLENLDGGKILFDGQDFSSMPPKDRSVGMVFQNYSLYPHLKVKENLAFPLKVQPLSKTEKAEKIAAVAKMLNLEKVLEKYPRQLSGGQKQRVAIGRCLIRNPRVYLFDEPLSNVDQRLRENLRSEIRHLHNQNGWTTILVTHDQAEAMSLADQIIVMRDGTINQIGAPEDLYHQPTNLFVAQFIGFPEINRLEGKLEQGVFKTALPEDMHFPEWAGCDLTKATLSIRPNDLKLAEETPADPNAYIEISAPVVSRQFQGSFYHSQISVGGRLWWVESKQAFAGEGPRRFYLPKDKILWFDAEGNRLLPKKLVAK